MGAFSGMRICDTKAFSGWRRILKITTLGEDGEAPLLPLNHLESTSQNLSFAHEQLPTNSRGYLRFISGSQEVIDTYQKPLWITEFAPQTIKQRRRKTEQMESRGGGRFHLPGAVFEIEGHKMT